MEDKNHAKKSNNVLRFAALILFLVLSWLTGVFFNIDLDYYKNILSRFPIIYSGIIFVGLYVGVSFFIWLAKDIFKIIGAVLFGAYLSSLFIFIAEILNASVLFHLSRFLGRDFVKSKLKGGWQNLDESISQSGFWGIFVLRIVPLVPYRFLDIAAGLTKISFSQYMLAVVLGSPLRIFWLQFILSVVGENVFKNPNLIIEYFHSHPAVLFFSFIYAVTSFILAIFIKKAFGNSKNVNCQR